MKNFKAFILSMVLIPQLAMAMPTKVDGLRSVGNVNVTGNVTATGSITGASAAISGSASVAGSLSVGTSSAADSKSVIDMVSTTKGMLPPRMTTTQRDAIASPPAGLTVYNTTTNALNAFNGTVWKAVGSGSGDGGINYITNGKAEDDASGWAAYADAAGTAPVDGTGGSPTGTFARTTSSPLQGVGSFIWTKPASNIQGQGFSYDFTIDAGFQGQQMAINYLTSVVSGTYVAGDMSVWIYDVTNARVIQPSAYLIGATTIPGPAQQLTFQTAINSTSYRLIFHTGTTSALAYVLKTDIITTGPQVSSTGPHVTGTTAFTPTGSWTTNSTYTGRWWQVGDRLYFRVRVALAGAPNATSLTINYLPPGLAVDTSKMLGTATNGSVPLAKCNMQSAASGGYEGMGYWNGAGNLAPVAINAAGTYGTITNITQAAPATFASGDSVECSSIDGVPIVGWSSNTIVSSSAATRVVATHVTKSTSQVIAGTGTGAQIAFWDVPQIDTHGSFNATTGEWTAKVPGIYKFSAKAQLTFSATASMILSIRKNGSPFFAGIDSKNTGGSSVLWAAQTSGLISVNAGDVVAAFVSQNTGANQSTAGDANVMQFTAEMIQGPAQIQAASSIALMYTNTAGTAMPTGNTLIPFATKVYDNTGGAWNGSVFTCPAYGIYPVKATANVVNGSYTAGQGHRMYIRKNGNVWMTGPQWLSVGSVGSTIGGNSVSADVECFQGETIDVFWSHVSGASPSLSTAYTNGNTISISRQNTVQ